jgi:hypothetical protein
MGILCLNLVAGICWSAETGCARVLQGGNSTVGQIDVDTSVVFRASTGFRQKKRRMHADLLGIFLSQMQTNLLRQDEPHAV